MITETTGWCEVVEDCDVEEPPVASIEVFNPDDSQQHRKVPRDVLLAYSPHIGMQRIRYFAGPYQLKKDVSSVVIQIDGVCRGNETRYRGAWGVFFGPESQYNKSGLLPPDAPQTSTYAELYALVIALETIRDEVPLCPERVFIMSDSSYVAHAFTEYMSVWRQNGRIRAAHWNFVMEIKGIIDEVPWSSDRNMEFKFWHAPRELNLDANALANRAFN
ncbi:hypothetical protein LB503_004339 [Fusarium chuoi]|nr:hypothetical protein LB503_004339 [Fusarium chuoi]